MTRLTPILPTRLTRILPTKGRTGLLEESLGRLVRNPSYETIVADGSRDGAARQVTSRFNGIVDTYLSIPDSSPTEGFNNGLKKARGQYVKIETDDDKTFKAGLETALEALTMTRPQIDVLVCGGTKRKGDRVKRVSVPLGHTYAESPDSIVTYGAPGIGLIMRRSVFDTVMMDPGEPLADVDFVLRCHLAGLNVKFCRVRLYDHPILPHSLVWDAKRIIPAKRPSGRSMALRESFGHKAR